MKKYRFKLIIFSVVIIFTFLSHANPTPFSKWITHHSSIHQSNILKPEINAPFFDPVFGTKIVRLSIANKLKASSVIPQYSKRQAWNSNESLFLLHSGDGKVLLYDGNSYKLNKVLEDVYGDDIFWHPSNPYLLYYAVESSIYLFNIKNNQRKKIYTFHGYDFADTKGEGNLSKDGRYYALAGRTYNSKTSEITYKDFLVFDMYTQKVISKLAVPKGIEAFDWISISTNGSYVVVDYADDIAERFHGLEVYDRNFNFIWQKPLGAGHSDLGIDENGDEVLIMDIYDPETNKTFINKFRLSDGKETTLLEISPLFDLHISCRNENPGTSHPQTGTGSWCLISTFDFVGRLTDTTYNWLPFEDEVFFLKLDGSGSVMRVAHHHSRRYSPLTPDSDKSVYWAEPHATVSRNGNRILFGSNWRENIASQSSVDTYLIDLR